MSTGVINWVKCRRGRWWLQCVRPCVHRLKRLAGMAPLLVFVFAVYVAVVLQFVVLRTLGVAAADVKRIALSASHFCLFS